MLRTMLKMKWIYARSLYEDPAATPDDLREAVTTLEDIERIARRVFGGAHPLTEGMEEDHRRARRASRPPRPRVVAAVAGTKPVSRRGDGAETRRVLGQDGLGWPRRSTVTTS